LPYYEITWHRNDVDVTRLTENGNVGDKAIIIEVSGIDSSLISYSKLGMPLAAISANNQPSNHSMKTTKRFALGIFLGATCGAVIAGICLMLPTVHQTNSFYNLFVWRNGKLFLTF